MKRILFSLSLVLFSSNLNAVIITNYPDPLTYPGDPDYRPRTSYVVPTTNPNYQNQYQNQYQYQNRYPYQNQYQNQYPYNNDGVETRIEAANRHFDQQRETLIESDPDRSGQQRRLDERVLKQDEALRNRVLKQEEALNRY